VWDVAERDMRLICWFMVKGLPGIHFFYFDYLSNYFSCMNFNLNNFMSAVIFYFKGRRFRGDKLLRG